MDTMSAVYGGVAVHVRSEEALVELLVAIGAWHVAGRDGPGR